MVQSGANILGSLSGQIPLTCSILVTLVQYISFLKDSLRACYLVHVGAAEKGIY